MSDIETIDLEHVTDEALRTALWVGHRHCDEYTIDPCSDGVDYCVSHPLDDDYGVDDVSDRARAELRERLAAFIETYADDVAAYLTHEQITGTGHGPEGMLAHDYILTCDGHGTGFWDRGLGDLGRRLADAARAEGGWTLYVGDDGELYAD